MEFGGKDGSIISCCKVGIGDGTLSVGLNEGDEHSFEEHPHVWAQIVYLISKN